MTVVEQDNGLVERDIFSEIADKFDQNAFQKLNREMSFDEYIRYAVEHPLVSCSAYQRIYHMILQAGVDYVKRNSKTYCRYKFFAEHAEYPVHGLLEAIERFVANIKGAAGWFGNEKRILLLHGPVGSSKSTAVRAIKRGLERFSLTDRGELYTFKWVNLPVEADDKGPALELQREAPCPMQDDPLKLIPHELRPMIVNLMNEKLQSMTLHEDKRLDDELKRIIKIKIDGELNPHDKFFYKNLLKRYKGDWRTVVKEHVRVVRVTISEIDRVGIGTFQPKDEKNQDATELTGDVNYRKLGQYGQDSDPRCFNFDGEFQVANRGVLEMIEMLKLDQQFLYDLLGAAQEQQVKPKKFPQMSVDVAIIGHTNNPEYVKLENNESMEALKDRTIRCDWPYNLRWSDEIKVLSQDFNPQKIRQHIAPHTIEIAALFGILSRLKMGKELHKIDPVKKAKLYDGRSLPGYTEESVREMMEKDTSEGMDQGVSARYLQNKISNALVRNNDYVNFFMVLHELKEGLRTYALLGNNAQLRDLYESCIAQAKQELEEILKTEVQRALVVDTNAINTLFASYLDNLFAYIENKKVKNEFTGEMEEPNERLMRSIEEKIEVSESTVDDFRRMIAGYVGNIVRNDGKEALKWDSNPQLGRALELKLFDDVKDTIKLSTLTKVAGIANPEDQEKIEVVKQRLIKDFGYDSRSAADVLHYVGSIFARGDIQDNK